MRILHTAEFYSPSVGGAQEVVRQISEELARRGHEVTVATTRLAKRNFTQLNGVKIIEFDIAGNAVRGFRGDTVAYQQFLMSTPFDIMMNYAAQQWTADLTFPLLSKLPYAKVLAPCGFSGLFDPQYSKYFEEMPEVLRRYDGLIFHSFTGRDIQFAERKGLKKLTVIPNGASGHEFGTDGGNFRLKHGIPPDVPLLLTVGSHNRMKGHALAIEAFQRAEIGRAVFVIIGNYIGGIGCRPSCTARAFLTRLRSAGRKRVLLLNCPREDVVAAFKAADLFVFASAIECSPLVLFEAMASETPFITIGCGNAAEITDWSQGGILIPTAEGINGGVTANPDDIARSIEALVHDKGQRETLARNGHRTWAERFTWQRLAGDYERLYQQCVSYTSV